MLSKKKKIVSSFLLPINWKVFFFNQRNHNKLVVTHDCYQFIIAFVDFTALLTISFIIICFLHFQKEKTTIEILENLETKIKDIENFSISTQERQKRFVGNFLVTSIGLYVISSIIFYFAFFPSTWSKRISYSTPLLIFPIL